MMPPELLRWNLGKCRDSEELKMPFYCTQEPDPEERPPWKSAEFWRDPLGLYCSRNWLKESSF